MKLNKDGAEIFIPDNKPVGEAVKRITYMSVAAHQDDIEIMSSQGILKCFGKEDEWFFGVVVTNGGGSPREDMYAKYSDSQMQQVRKLEQKKAAFVGEYGALALMNYSSSEVKDNQNNEVIYELKELILAARPHTIYTHNLADKHDTHVSTAVKVIKAIRQLPEEDRPDKLFGCEVWRSLDWLSDNDKEVFDVSDHPNIAASLIGVYDSQICGGKRYDLGTEGRRLANATYSESHKVDKSCRTSYGMDLTPLIKDPAMEIDKYLNEYIKRFCNDVSTRLLKYL